MRRLGTALLLCACLTASAFGWIEETGTLRGFILGHCPTCAYDNWESHVVEGANSPSVNDYGPSWFDPQTNGFGRFTVYTSADTAAGHPLWQWRQVFNAAVQGQWSRVDSALATHTSDWRYELVRLQDTELNRTYYILRERLDSSFVDSNVVSDPTDDVIGSFDNGWGVFVFNTAPLMPKLEVEIVHPEDDFLAIPIGLELFIRTNARAFMIAGACREVLWTSGQSYNNSNSLSDPSRNGYHPLEVCHEALFDGLDAGPTSPEVTVQMHSYDHALHLSSSDIELSAFDTSPNPPFRDRASHIDVVNLMSEWPVHAIPGDANITCRINQYVGMSSSPLYLYYGATDTIQIPGVQLPGYGANKQADYSHNHRVHDQNRDPENFLHAELDEYPDELWTPVDWHQWLPGHMPATIDTTYQPAIAYYQPFITAMDSALRVTFLYPDTIAPTAVHLDQVTHAGADSIVLRWSPVALDRMFDSYILYYDTTEISGSSPTITRLTSGYSGMYSSLGDYMRQSATIRGLPRAASHYRFAVGSRDIYGNTAVGSNSTGLTGGTVAFVLPDPYMGCAEACHNDTLYLTFDQAGYRSGKTYVVLPARLEVAWPLGTGDQNVYPASNAAANLATAIAKRVGTSSSDTVQVNVTWSNPYSLGDLSRYIAAIPIHNQSATATQTLTITTRDTTSFTNGSGPQVNQFAVGPATVYVDCAAPTAVLAYHSAPSCPFGSAAALQGRYYVTVLRGAVPTNSPLSSAYVEVNGNAAQRVTVFNARQTGDYVSGAFPDSAQAAQLWSYLPEGCCNVILHAFDTECNEGVATALSVAKDTSSPLLTVTNNDTAFCYFNIPGSSNYGGTALDERLDISTVLGAGTCASGIGSVIISYGSQSFLATNLPPDLVAYPTSDSAASALWAWIAYVVPASANGESYVFTVRAEDCAGNARSSTFALHIDMSPPTNTLTQLTARPTDMGVWLKWDWTFDPVQAVSMEIWRSSYSSDYPTYSTNRWEDLSNGAFYPRSYPPLGFVRVVEQNGSIGTTSESYAGVNGKGHLIHGPADSLYWMDEDSSWRDEHEQRDIYRYVSYVKDAGGTASVVSAYSVNINADRSTNYWLGDFSRDATVDPNGSSGIVSTADLTLFSAYYFTSVPPTPGYFDIGPENAEHDVGKGIPMPDGEISFSDLIPLSMNFGTTGAGTFSTRRPVTVPRSVLDERPIVSVTRTGTKPFTVGAEFTLVVTVQGAATPYLKAVESRLCYDRAVLELLSVAAETLRVGEGLTFAAAKELRGEEGVVGVTTAAIGEQAHLREQGAMARLTFRWKNLRVGDTEIMLRDTKVADVNGTAVTADVENLTLNALNAIPTRYALYQNFPNPFNPSTQIRYDLPDDGPVRLEIFNCLGQRIATLMNGPQPAGAHTVTWDGKSDAGTALSAGVYICHINAGRFAESRKMLLLK